MMKDFCWSIIPTTYKCLLCGDVIKPNCEPHATIRCSCEALGVKWNDDGTRADRIMGNMNRIEIIREG